MSSCQCSRCEALFNCGSPGDEKGCWCHTYPAIFPVDSAKECLCQRCLAQTIAAQIKTTMESSSLEKMLHLASQSQSDNQLVEYIDYTLEAGRYVFTGWYHLKRGSCCGNGCRHCPFGQVAVVVP